MKNILISVLAAMLTAIGGLSISWFYYPEHSVHEPSTWVAFVIGMILIVLPAMKFWVNIFVKHVDSVE